MSKIASVLKQEILRLARKEIRTQTAVLRRANAQYRRDVAELKRQTHTLAQQVEFLERQERKRGAATPPPSPATGIRFSKRGLKTHRDKLGLGAGDYAKLVGVSTQTIYNWEQGKSRPRDEQLAALATVRNLGKREAIKRLDLLAS